MRKRRPKLRRFRVLCRTPEKSITGSVLLFEGDLDHYRIEHALVALGIYAPRGADRVVWSKKNQGVRIYEGGTDLPIVELWQGDAFPADWHKPKAKKS